MRKRILDDRGAAAVEFALLVFPLLLILFGAFDFGRFFFIQNSVTNGVRVGARTMVVESAAGNPAALQHAKDAAARAASGVIGSGDVRIDPSTCPATQPGQTPVSIAVSVVIPISQTTRLLPIFPSEVRASAVMQCEN